MATHSNSIKALKIAAVALTLGLIAAPALAEEMCNGHRMPPAQYQREPSVHYQIVTLDPAAMEKRYPGGSGLKQVWGAMRTEHANPPTWRGTKFTIFIRGGLAPADHACILAYEKAHLPPNLWNDAKIESPSVIRYWAAIPGSHIAY